MEKGRARYGIGVALPLSMAEPENEHQVSRKVVVEQVSSSSTSNSVVAWVIIAVLAVALIAYIFLKL